LLGISGPPRQPTNRLAADANLSMKDLIFRTADATHGGICKLSNGCELKLMRSPKGLFITATRPDGLVSEIAFTVEAMELITSVWLNHQKLGPLPYVPKLPEIIDEHKV
jgi:hypothetical protein